MVGVFFRAGRMIKRSLLGVTNYNFRIKMKSFNIWIRSVSRWLVEWRYFCLGLLVVAVPIWLAIRYGADEATIRIMGLILQLLGIGTVIWDINSTRKEFGHPGAFKVWHRRLRSFPLFGNQAGTATGHATLPAMISSGRAHQTVSAGPEAKSEERLQALEENLRLVHERISHSQNEVDQQFRKYFEELNFETQARVQEDKKNQIKLEATETGGLHILGMGALWLFQGVIMSTVPAEIAKLLK